jgi:predicted AAA+ superfamily ATPase
VEHSYLPRLADAVLTEIVREHPAVLVVGPRATGKTTTSERQAATPIRLGNPRQAAAAMADPTAIIRGRAAPILIDEWQIVPEMLAAIKEQVDQRPTPGQFIVTGSVRGDIDSPTWPGTGRLVRLPMYGLTEREIEGRLSGASWIDRVLSPERFQCSSDVDLRGYVERALRSGFPEPALRLGDSARRRWLSSYVDQLVTRDAQDVEARRDPVRLRRYLEALAINSAGIVDDVTLYESAGVNKLTARAYDQLLQNLLVIDKIPSWTSNRLKRMVLAPKRYLVDPGLFTGVLGLSADDVLEDGDVLGRVLDTFVVAQLRAECALRPVPLRLHHLRTQQGRHEVDLIIETGPRKLIAIEVKATSRPSPSDAVHLHWLCEELGEQVRAAVVLHTGGHTADLGSGVMALPIASLWS